LLSSWERAIERVPEWGEGRAEAIASEEDEWRRQ